ncbi:16S rRNA (guanine(527)-N(7))-methyltransferase RsmG, partial [Xanthomonas citri pv. citri]|nr:16S rRNA (guanine(527)-N(7))-methyltransferase RsmG [Xanthomonas citri pv. citri]
VTSRAVARIGELARWSLPLVQRGGEMFVLKGSSAALERDEDASILRKLKVVEADVETWGAGIVDPETVTLRLSVEGV